MSDNVGRDQLRALAERRIRLDEEKDALVADISEVNAEAKAAGYTLKAFNSAIKVARMNADQRQKYDSDQMDLVLYLEALDGVEG